MPIVVLGGIESELYHPDKGVSHASAIKGRIKIHLQRLLVLAGMVDAKGLKEKALEMILEEQGQKGETLN